MSKKSYRRRQSLAITIIGVVVALFLAYHETNDFTNNADQPIRTSASSPSDQPLAVDSLAKLAVKGRAPKTNYSRSQFGNGWAVWRSCDTRQRILLRDLTDVVLSSDNCTVSSGTLHDPYTAKVISFMRGSGTSSLVQIDHVVALSDAWQKGAQGWTTAKREQLANDDLELLAVDGAANQQKSDGDAATWLPSNKAFRCQYVARQIAVKLKYELWITSAEHDAMQRVLADCPQSTITNTLILVHNSTDDLSQVWHNLSLKPWVLGTPSKIEWARMNEWKIFW